MEQSMQGSFRRYIMDLYDRVKKRFNTLYKEYDNSVYTELNIYDVENKLIKDFLGVTHRLNLLKDIIIEIETEEYYHNLDKKEYRNKILEFVEVYSVESSYEVRCDLFDRKKAEQMRGYQMPAFIEYKKMIIDQVEKIYSGADGGKRAPYRCELKDEEKRILREKLTALNLTEDGDFIGWLCKNREGVHRTINRLLQESKEKRVLCISPRAGCCGGYWERDGVELDLELLELDRLNGDIYLLLKDMSLVFYKDHEDIVYKYKGDECCE